MKNSVEYAFERLTDIRIILGNVCRIEIIDGEDTKSRITVEGDATFIDYFNIENVSVENFLDLNVSQRINGRQNYERVCSY